MNAILSILSGVLLAFSFPEYNLWWLAWFSLLPLLYAIKNAKGNGQAAVYGFFTGCAFNGITFSFILPLKIWAGNLIYLGWILLFIFLSLYIALFGCLLRKMSNGSNYFMLAPLLWVFVEWLRSLGPFGLVASLGYSQWLCLPIIQVASLTGVVGISFLIILTNGVLADIFFNSRLTIRRKLFLGSGLVLVIGGVWVYGMFSLYHDSLIYAKGAEISLIHGNYSQEEKLEYSNLLKIKQKYLELTEKTCQMSPHIVLWPETAIPFYIQDDRAYLTKLRSMAKERRINLILGLPRYDTHFNAYNSALFISSSGEILGWQDKRRLVPFGEYIPFRPMLIPLFKRFKGLEYALLMQKDFIAGGLGEPIVTPAGKIGVGVCSDSFFPDVFKGFDDRGVDYFFIITNDAWFYPSAASRLHILGSILRAVEFRRYVSQCANRGISAVIDSYGRIIGEAGAGQEKIINAKIYKVEGKTIYSQWGEWFRTGCLLILLMYGLLRIFKRI